MTCPLCGSRVTGKISGKQYYCWNCFVEYNEAKEVFQIGEDGSLIRENQTR